MSTSVSISTAYFHCKLSLLTMHGRNTVLMSASQINYTAFTSVDYRLNHSPGTVKFTDIFLFVALVSLFCYSFHAYISVSAASTL